MGLLRKALIIGTGGLAPIKGDSKKERTAKATEKLARLQQQQARAATPAASVPPTVGQIAITRSASSSPGQLARQARREARNTPGAQPVAAAAEVQAAPDIATELGRIAALHQSGVLTDDEFAAAKAKVLGS